MIYKKAFEKSKIPTFVLDVTDFLKKFQINKRNILDDSVGASILNYKISEDYLSLINIYSINNEGEKFFKLDLERNHIYDELKKCFIFNKTVENIVDIIKSESKIIEYKTFNGLKEEIFNIFCYKIYHNYSCYVFCHIIDVEKCNIRDLNFYSFVEKYFLLLGAINDAMILVDINEDCVVEYNRHAASLLGIKDINNKIYHYKFYENDERIKYLEYFKNKLNGGDVESKELNLHINGLSIPVKIKISISYINGLKMALIIFVDLRGQYQLEKRRKLLATAVDQVAESVIITDSYGDIEYVNSAYEKISGFTFSEVSGEQLNILKSDNANTYHYKLMWDEISNGRVWRGNITNKKKNGDTYCEDVTISPVKDGIGNIVNYVAVKRDITQHILVENQIRQSQKMHAIGMLAGGIAHDFNNILTSILGFAELCKIQCDKNNVIYSNIEEIIQASLRASELVDQILKFSKNKNKEIYKFKIANILKEVVRLISAAIHPGIEIILEVVNDPKITGDQTQLHQVLMNLCTNAYQSIVTEEGTIKISLFTVLLSPREAIEIGRLSPGEYVCIQIQDDGIGIPKEYIHRIFDPYFTTKKLNEGTGLGLSVVHGIVNDHRGAITVESEVGQGSCFRVYLPETVKDSEM